MALSGWLRNRSVLGIAAGLSIVLAMGTEPGDAQGRQGQQGQQAPAGPRQVPARDLPVPADVSPETAKAAAGAPGGNWNVIPKSPEEWTAAAGRGGGAPGGIGPGNQALLDRFGMTSEPTVINGVNAYMLTPKDIAPENKNRLLLHVHGGCYVMGGGGTAEGIYMAGFGKVKVLSVDYRRPPAAFFPAALDDVVNAWKGAIKTTDPKNMGMIGLSAGGGLVLSAIHKLKADKTPLPSAI